MELALYNTPASIPAPTLTIVVPQTSSIGGGSFVPTCNNATVTSHTPLIGHYAIFIPLCWTDRRFVWRWGCDRDCNSFLSVFTSPSILSKLSAVLLPSLTTPLIISNFTQPYCSISGVHYWLGISCKARRFQCHCWYNFWWWCIISGVVLKPLPVIVFEQVIFFWLQNHTHQYLSRYYP